MWQALLVLAFLALPAPPSGAKVVVLNGGVIIYEYEDGTWEWPNFRLTWTPGYIPMEPVSEDTARYGGPMFFEE